MKDVLCFSGEMEAYFVKRKYRNKKKKKVILVILFIIIVISLLLLIFRKRNGEDDLKNIDKNKDDLNETVDIIELQKAPINSEEFKLAVDGDYLTTNNYTLTIKDGIAYIDGLIIANKTYSLPSDYVPSNPYSGSVDSLSCVDCIDKTVMEAFKEMQADASSLGLNIYIQSGYRSYARQDVLFNNYVSVDGEEAADKYSSRPGHSEHQTGFCFDLNSIEDSFANTDEGKWVNDNAYLYGFVIRFPKGKDEYTGYQYESWHLRYVGKEIAERLYNNGDWLSIEEYYGITSRYN